jgi:hypothetical protein
VADLVVDLNLLESTDHSLGVLAGEFKDASSIVSGYADEIGAPVLVSALDQFCTDWKAHREKLLSSIKDVRELASQGHTQFRATDDKLARVLRSAPPSGGSA